MNMLLSKHTINCVGLAPRPLRRPVSRCMFRCRAASGDPIEPFSETAAQVKRLVQRDRKEFLGNAIDILDKYETEFGTDDPKPRPSASLEAEASASTATAAPSSTSSTSSSTTEPNGRSSSNTSSSSSSAPPSRKPAVISPFAASKPVSSPFAASSAMYKKSTIEPKGLTPDMSPDPIVKPAPLVGTWLSRITLTQVVLFLSFSTIIGLMIATFTVVVNTGAVRLAGI